MKIYPILTYCVGAMSTCAISGIGFDLTLSHGTSAIYFANGTTVAVSKVEGNSAYRSEMRRLVHEATTDAVHVPHVPIMYWIEDMISSFLAHLQITAPRPKKPLLAMLQTLKLATSSYLEIEVHNIELAFPINQPYTVEPDTQTAYLDGLLRTSGLKRTNQKPTTSALAACRGYGIGLSEHGQNDNSKGIKNVLSVDYSRAALALAVFELDCENFEEIRRTMGLHLGADLILEVPQYWTEVKAEIGKIVRYLEIDELVLTGDRVTDARLAEILRAVLGKKLGDKLRLGGRIEGLRIDPVFAVAIGVAMINFENVCWESKVHTSPAYAVSREILRDEV